MDALDFLTLADTLAAGNTEAEWSSALSRLYYAIFHVGRSFLRDLRFNVPRADRAHSYVYMRLANCGDPQVVWAARSLNNLRQLRNEADYDLNQRVMQAPLLGYISIARQIVQIISGARTEPTRTQVTDAIKIYERDVLQEVTWHP